MGINWRIRFKNPLFLWQLGAAVILPILAYGGLTIHDLTTWQSVWQMLFGAIKNPYVLGLVVVSVWNAVNDPTSTGITDSAKALTYTKPNDIKV